MSEHRVSEIPLYGSHHLSDRGGTEGLFLTLQRGGLGGGGGYSPRRASFPTRRRGGGFCLTARREVQGEGLSSQGSFASVGPSSGCTILMITFVDYEIGRGVGGRGLWFPLVIQSRSFGSNAFVYPGCAQEIHLLSSGEQPLESGKAVHSGYTNNRV